MNQPSALFRSTIPLGSNPCARKNRLQYGSSASELELRFGRGPRLPKYIPGFRLRQYPSQQLNFACVGFCLGLSELRARASTRFGSSALCRRKFSARGLVSHYAG